MLGISQSDWLGESSKAMREHVGGSDNHAAKRLARILECSPRTAENYLSGEYAPGGIYFLRAYALIPEFAAEVRRLTCMEQSLDPQFESALAQFLVKASKHMDARGEA